MAQIFSRSCEQAILALIYMAKFGAESAMDIAHMADALTISHHTLAKVLQSLVKTGMVASKKGPDGGFRLGRPAESIALMDILKAFHEDSLFRRCFIGIPECGDEAPCPLHAQWGTLRGKIQRLCESSTIADLAAVDTPSSYFSMIGPGATDGKR